MVILQQFSIITQELWNLSDKVSGDVNKITQVCTAAQENTGTLIENAILQALATPHDRTPPGPNPPREARIFTLNWASNLLSDVKFTASWQTDDFGVTQHRNRKAYHLQVPQETPTSPILMLVSSNQTWPHLILISLWSSYSDIKQNWHIVPNIFTNRWFVKHS